MEKTAPSRHPCLRRCVHPRCKSPVYIPGESIQTGERAAVGVNISEEQMKKCFLLLALLMVVLIPVAKPVAAIYSGDWSYELLDDGSVKITGYKGTETEVTIPKTLMLKPVTAIGNYAFSHTGLTSVIIPEGVTTIGYNAFYECENLTNVSLPSTLTSIGDYAFSNCENLTSVTLPKSLVTIGKSAFSATALSSV